MRLGNLEQSFGDEGIEDCTISFLERRSLQPRVYGFTLQG